MKQRLIDALAVQTTTYKTENMQVYILEQFEEIAGDDIDNFTIKVEAENIYISKGVADSYPCVVAHTDTVHDIVEDFAIFEHDGVLFSIDGDSYERTGIGGDDKVGVFIALEMLRSREVIKVAFFRDEEHGCLGSAEADMDWFDNVEFVLQCDRQKYVDFVRNICGNILFDDAFSDAIAPILKSYGKKETLHGGITDVGQLVDNGLDVCVANMSCGYYFPHTDDEVVSISEVYRTLATVDEIIEKLSGKIWKNSDYEAVKYTSRYAGYYGGYDDFNWNDRPKIGTGNAIIPENSSYIDGYEDYCTVCGSIETKYDPHADADWCYSCNEYTYHYGTTIPKRDDFFNYNDEDGIIEDSDGLVKILIYNKETAEWEAEYIEKEDVSEGDFLFEEWKDHLVLKDDSTDTYIEENDVPY